MEGATAAAPTRALVDVDSVPAHAAEPVGPAAPTRAAGVIETFPVLDGILPGAGLRRRQATAIADCPALVVELVCHLSAHGRYVAIVGWPELSLAQVADTGNLGRVVIIPDPGPQPWSVTSVLVGGMDVVIHRGPAPSPARPVLAKLRGGHAALVTVGSRLPGSGLTIDAQVTGYRGIGRGSGRIRGIDIAVSAQSKELPAPAVATVVCGEPYRLEAV